MELLKDDLMQAGPLCGEIFHCTHVPIWNKSRKPEFYDCGKLVIVLSQLNDYVVPTYIVTPIFSGPQSVNSIPIVVQSEQRDPNQVSIKLDSASAEALLGEPMFIDLNYILTYKPGWWMAPSGNKEHIFKKYASRLSLHEGSLSHLLDLLRQKLASKIPFEATAELSVQHDRNFPPDWSMDGEEGVFDEGRG